MLTLRTVAYLRGVHLQPVLALGRAARRTQRSTSYY